MSAAVASDDSKQTSWTKSIMSCCSGAIAGVISEILFYGIDSYKVMLQASSKVANNNNNNSRGNFTASSTPMSSVFNLFRGAVPIAIMGSGPSFGVFFLCYSPLHDYLTRLTNDEPLSVLIASSNLTFIYKPIHMYDL
jgi:hypothetical protein